MQNLRVLFLILSILMTPTVRAAEDLNLAFQQLQYALTVEWDQKDTAFYDEQWQLFTSSVESAAPAAKMSLLDGLAIFHAMSVEELITISHSQINGATRGASWVGQKKLVIGMVVAAAVVLTYYYMAASRIRY
jgi:hypothetical protein